MDNRNNLGRQYTSDPHFGHTYPNTQYKGYADHESAPYGAPSGEYQTRLANQYGHTSQYQGNNPHHREDRLSNVRSHGGASAGQNMGGYGYQGSPQSQGMAGGTAYLSSTSGQASGSYGYQGATQGQGMTGGTAYLSSPSGQTMGGYGYQSSTQGQGMTGASAYQGTMSGQPSGSYGFQGSTQGQSTTGGSAYQSTTYGQPSGSYGYQGATHGQGTAGGSAYQGMTYGQTGYGYQQTSQGEGLNRGSGYQGSTQGQGMAGGANTYPGNNTAGLYQSMIDRPTDESSFRAETTSGASSQTTSGASTDTLNQVTGENQSPIFNDRDRLQDLLSSEKYLTEGYNISTFEATDPQLHDTLRSILNDTHQNREQLYQTMEQRGWYKTEPADQQTIEQAYNQFMKNRHQLPF